MARNIEIKARIGSVEALLPRARALADGTETLIEQDDSFFTVPQGRLKLRQFADQRQELVKAFLVAYPALCQDAAKRLRGLYNPADYPPGTDVEREFGFCWQYISFGVPDQLREISTKIWHDEREKAAQMMCVWQKKAELLLDADGQHVGAQSRALRHGVAGRPVWGHRGTRHA